MSDTLRGRSAPRIRDFKVVRDPIHNFIRLYPHEVAIVDSPLLQRLRRIHQTGLAYFTYPGMHHTRFEHSLGVLHVAGLMLDALRLRHPERVTPAVTMTVRLAALLHDVGHVFLSHLGETLLEDEFGELFADLASAKVDGQQDLFKDVPPGEVLSYLIVTSDAFRPYLQTALGLNPVPGLGGPSLSDIDLVEVGRLIIRKISHQEKQFMADIINGGMDADKIDYIMRDCHYSGIRAEIDAARLLNTIEILLSDGWPRSLTASGTALHHLEQILLAKLVLYTSLYHHHKIRASEIAVRIIFDRLRQVRESLRDNRLKFRDVTSFLRMTDSELFVAVASEDGFDDLIRDVMDRKFLKRSLVLSRKTVHGESQKRFIALATPSETPSSQVRRYEEIIYESLPAAAKAEREWLRLDFPPLPDADEEAGQIFMQMGLGEPEALKDLLPTDDWLRTYSANKYRAHLFYVGEDEKRRMAAHTAEQVLRDRLNLRLTPLARSLAHLD